MKVLGETVKLDRNAGGVDYEPKHWLACGKELGSMHHLPTGTKYMVEFPPEFFTKGEANILNITAKLTDVEHLPIPSKKEQNELGRAAIAVFLQEVGVWKPVATEVPDRPQYAARDSNKRLTQ